VSIRSPRSGEDTFDLIDDAVAVSPSGLMAGVSGSTLTAGMGGHSSVPCGTLQLGTSMYWLTTNGAAPTGAAT
jgi:hypothetical protein